ncbi:MAG: hypothetical protein V4574_17575 [Pseudomonadota bacterium]
MSQEALIEVLEEARDLLSRPDNDFMWSRWRNASAAVADIDHILKRIGAAETIKLAPIEALFAPTGSLQEVSEGSGWGDEFLALSSRFDAAIEDL